MQDKEFDVNKWEGYCKLFDRNREGLQMHPKFQITNGKMNLSLPNVKKKYISPLQKLAKKCIDGSVYYMVHQFSPDYASESDYEEEYKKNMAAMKENMEYYLNIFLRKVLIHFWKQSNMKLLSTVFVTTWNRHLSVKESGI